MSVYHGYVEFNFDVIGTVADMLGVTRLEAKRQIFEKAIQTGRIPAPKTEWKGLEPELDDHGLQRASSWGAYAWRQPPPPPRETPGEPFRYRPGRFALGLRHLWEALIGPWTYQ